MMEVNTHDNRIKTYLRRASENVIESLASETKILNAEDEWYSHNYGAPLRRASDTFVSFANDIYQVFGTSSDKIHVDIGEEAEKIKDASDEAKLKALKHALKNKTIVTNMAIQQYLLEHNESLDECEFGRHRQKLDSYRASPDPLLCRCQPK